VARGHAIQFITEVQGQQDQIDEHFAAEAAVLGVEAASLIDRTQVGDEFHLLPENLMAFEVFCALATQWRWLSGATDSIRIGLDYCSVESTLRLCGIDQAMHSAIFGSLRTMEQAALAVFRHP